VAHPTNTCAPFKLLVTTMRWRLQQPTATATRRHMLSLRLGHTPGCVSELSRAFGARPLVMALGKSSLPFHFGAQEITDRAFIGSCWTPLVRLSHYSSVRDTNHLATATCSPTCPPLVISLFPQTVRLQITANKQSGQLIPGPVQRGDMISTPQRCIDVVIFPAHIPSFSTPNHVCRRISHRRCAPCACAFPIDRRSASASSVTAS